MDNQGKDLGHAIEFLRALNQGLRLDELAKSVLRYALSQVPHAQGGSLLVLNKAKNVFEFRAAVGWDIARLSRIKIPKDYVLQKRLGHYAPAIIREPEKLNRKFLPAEIANQLGEFPVAAFISFPIVHEGEVIAYLNVDNRDDPNAFSQADINQLALIEEEITLAVRLGAEQERLATSEARFRNLLETLPDAVVSIDEQGIIRTWNKGAELSFGYSPEEILGKPVILLMPEKYKKQHARAFASCVADTRAPTQFVEVEGLRKDGTTFPIQWSLSAFQQEGKRFFVAVGRDLTERVRAEKELRESEKRFKLFFERLADAVFIVSLTGEILEANPAASRQTGYSHDELIGMNIMKDLAVAEPVVTYEGAKKQLEKGETVFFEEKKRRKDGTVYWTECAVTPVEYKGQPVTLSVNHDITARKEKEEALRQSEERYRTVVENTGTATVIIEEDATISLVNTEFERLSGYSKQEVEGKKSWMEFVAPADLERMKKRHQLREADPEAVPKQYEFRFIGKDKKIKDVLLTVDMIPGTKRSVASLLDITARKQARETLRQQAEHLAAINRIATAVSSSLELDEILNIAVRQMAELFAVDHSGIMIFDEKKEWGYVRAEYPDWGAIAARFQVKGYLAAERIIADQKPLAIEDVEKDPLMAKAQEVVHRLGIKSMFIVPLVVKGETIGSIGLDTRDRRNFSQQEIELAQAIASQLATAIENARLHQAVRKELAERKRIGKKLEGLHHAVDQLQRCVNESELWETTGRIIKEVLQFDEYDLAVKENDELVSVRSGEEIPGVPRIKQEKGGIAWKTLQEGKTFWGDLHEFPEEPGAEEYRSFISVPIGNLGILQVVAREKEAFTQDDVNLLEILANHLREEIARVRLEEELKRQAIRDPLTDLYNRRYLDEVLKAEVRRAQRYGHPFTVMILDLDEFKGVNDRYGHLKGDEVLRAVADLLRETVRESDLIFRYGGDEFLLIFPETNGEARRLANRLRRGLTRWGKDQGLEGVNLGVSFGVAHWTPDNPLSVEELLRRADSGLYRAKRHKKSRR